MEGGLELLNQPWHTFSDRKIAFGPTVLENILQEALLNKDSLHTPWLCSDQEKRKALHFPPASAIKHWLSSYPFYRYVTPPKATDFIAANYGTITDASLFFVVK